jgi:glycerol kinase
MTGPLEGRRRDLAAPADGQLDVLAVGLWSNPGEIAAIRAVDRRFEPVGSNDRREADCGARRRVVDRSRGSASTG